MKAVPRLRCVLAVLVAAGSARGEMVTRWLARLPSASPDVVRFDLSILPGSTRLYRADLLVSHTAEIPGRDDDALASIEIVPLFGDRERGSTLELRGPWFDRLDATAPVRAWVSGKPRAGFLVKACPRATVTFLDVAYEGEPQDLPPPVEKIEVVHRKGQSFVLFQEIDERSAELSPTWGVLKRRLARMDVDRVVRYRIYRHAEPITPSSLPHAEPLGEVRPMSGYNVRGRSVDELTALHRRRALEDMEFAKRLAAGDYFSHYRPDMDELPIRRLAVEDSSPLPARMGLYVHQPRVAGRAYYTVTSVVDGVANTRNLPTTKPVEEAVGLGDPVLQRAPAVTVFFDYPGERRHYVQWTAPPLSNLPGQYYNWGIFVPEGHERSKSRRLSIFFHDRRERYLKPPWPHRRDTVLLAPHDAPHRSYGYGHHEALGTLRSLRQGKVRPYFGRRVDAMRDWAVKRFRADPGSVSCGGRGHWGGTAALQYGLRRPGRIAYIMVEDSPEADPRQTPHEFSYYGRGDTRKTQRPEMEAVWGRAEWSIEAESGKPIWDEMNLVALVQSQGGRRTFPFLSLGAGSMHVAWKQETDLMKAYLETHNAFMAEFFWGSSSHRHLPVTIEQGDHLFEPRSDCLVLACNPRERSPNPAFFDNQFATGRRGYSGGSRLNTRPRWSPEGIVDTSDRLEVTIYAARRVVYAGRVTCDVFIRNTQRFRPRPGEELRWHARDLERPDREQRGKATVDENGLIPIHGLSFGPPTRLVVCRAVDEEKKP